MEPECVRFCTSLRGFFQERKDVRYDRKCIVRKRTKLSPSTPARNWSLLLLLRRRSSFSSRQELRFGCRRYFHFPTLSFPCAKAGSPRFCFGPPAAHRLNSLSNPGIIGCWATAASPSGAWTYWRYTTSCGKAVESRKLYYIERNAIVLGWINGGGRGLKAVPTSSLLRCCCLILFGLWGWLKAG